MGQNNNLEPYSISVVIPAYNAEKFINRAIDSVLAQTYQPDEIIVVDDGSTDDTVSVVSKYGSQVKLIRQENAGASAARNSGINAATCQWIAFLDSDDEWLPEKLQLQIELLKRDPNLVWTAGNYYRCLCTEKRKAIDISSKKLRRMLAGKEYFADFLKSYIQGARGHTDTMLIKRSTLIEAGLFTPGQARFNDMDMWLKIAYLYPAIGFEPKPLAIHHLNIPQSISDKRYSSNLYVDFIHRHLELAAKNNRLDEFKPFAAFLLRRWTRSMLFDAKGQDIRQIMKQFSKLLPISYKMSMYILTVCPKLTATCCRIISKVIRSLNLRKGIVRKHPQTG